MAEILACIPKQELETLRVAAGWPASSTADSMLKAKVITPTDVFNRRRKVVVMSWAHGKARRSEVYCFRYTIFVLRVPGAVASPKV